MGGRRRTTTDTAAARRAEEPPHIEPTEARREAPSLETGPPVPPESPSRARKAMVLSLWSRVQALIGVLTGVLSIAGALYSGVTYLSAPQQGDLAALVRESRTERPLSDATVEVLTPDDVLVTTLAPAAD